MPLPVIFGAITTATDPLSLLDTNYNAVAALGSIPCVATGQNTIALAPGTNTPTISSYPDLAPSFVFAAAQTSNGAVSINVNGVGARNAYKWNGAVQCGSGDIIAGNVYRATPLQALNAGAGGFVVDAIGINNNVFDVEFIIDGGGVAITTGAKGSLRVPWNSVVTGWSVIADQSGSIAVDILRANDAVPTVSMIGAGNKPSLSAAQFAGDVAPSGWTSTTIVGDDWLTFSVTSVATVTRVTVDLHLAKV